MAVELWVEKYRPKTMDEYVWRDPAMREKAEEWVAAGALPHLLLSGRPGCGKTSLAKMLLNVLNIPAGDILYINASKERKVEDIQDRLNGFVSTWALGLSGIKYVILDEFDRVSPTAQDMLRADMETYSDICRIIATCNNEHRITPALKSRFTELRFATLDKEQFSLRAGTILTEEGVEFDVDDLLTYVNVSYPDMRKCIGLMQDNTRAGKLHPPRADDGAATDFLVEVLVLFREGRYNEARKLIIEKAQPEEYPEIYRFFYRNLELFGETQEQQDDALLVIRKAVYQHTIAADAEINLAGALVELTRIALGKPL